jgi:hypothetical protein
MTTAAIALGLWLVLCAAFLVAEHRWHARQRVLRISPPYPADVPVPWPTTPPFSRTVAPAHLFDGIPSDCLGDDAVHSLFDSIVAGEFK